MIEELQSIKRTSRLFATVPIGLTRIAYVMCEVCSHYSVFDYTQRMLRGYAQDVADVYYILVYRKKTGRRNE